MEMQNDLIFLKFDSAILGAILWAKLLLSFLSVKDKEIPFLQNQRRNANTKVSLVKIIEQ